MAVRDGGRGLACWRLALLGVLTILIAACSSTHWSAPTDGRVDDGAGQTITGTTYRVRAGDTLQSVGRRAAIDHRKIAEWNGLSSPDRIYVGQLLRLTPPTEGHTRSPERQGGITPGGAAKAAPARVTTSAPASARPSPVVAGAADRLRWQWPTAGRVVQRFSTRDSARKGVKIGGRTGQPILAAEGGEVVYSGSGLVGYGPLIIIKHNNNYLSAYGHNRKLLVQQGDQVTRGAQIAEMGLAGGTPLLHFEIRRDGDPVDPLALLPRR